MAIKTQELGKTEIKSVGYITVENCGFATGIRLVDELQDKEMVMSVSKNDLVQIRDMLNEILGD